MWGVWRIRGTNIPWYDPDGARFLRKESWRSGSTQHSRWVLYLLGGTFEEVQTPSDPTIAYHQKVQVTPTVQYRLTRTKAGATSVTYEYLHRDHLGSVDRITSSNGSLLHRLSHDPFGARRESNWSADITTASLNTVLAANSTLTSRGFTDHEHLDRTGIVHMNGRLYDPRIGRFLQPDPFVSDPANSQSHNRYAYVGNQPLARVDPSGLMEEVISTASRGGGPDVIITDMRRTLVHFPENEPKIPEVMHDVQSYLTSTTPADEALEEVVVSGSRAHQQASLPLDLPNRGNGFLRGLHEVAKLLVPGYDLVSCMVNSGSCGAADVVLGGVGVIPGGKVAALGAKGLMKLLRAAKAARGTINPSLVRFSQDSVKSTFRNGQSLNDAAQALRSGGAAAGAKYPAIRLVEHEGKLFTLDNRRLLVFSEAGQQVPFRMATQQEITREFAGKFTTTAEQGFGQYITVRP